MRARATRGRRRGAAMVEAAVVLMVFLTLVLGMLDLGIAVFRHHVVSQAARQGARRAIVHGKLAPEGWDGGPWGPDAYARAGIGTAEDGDPIASAIRPHVAALDPATVTIGVTWPDGNNKTEDRVRVTVSTTWTPIVTFLFGGDPRTLSASSAMPIAH